MPNAYTEDRLIKHPATGLFAALERLIFPVSAIISNA
jgi:hypothetical protein